MSKQNEEQLISSSHAIGFAFIAHWVESWNWLLWYSRDLHRNPQHASRYWYLWPICYLASIYYLLGSSNFDVVDDFEYGNLMRGKTVLVRNFGWHFFIAKSRSRIRDRILKTVLKIQDQVDVIGLGALTKAEWLTQGGKWIVDELGENLRVPIVHGDTLTAAAVILTVQEARQTMATRPVIFITGATSKIGRAVVLSLASFGFEIVMYSENSKRVKAIREEAGEAGAMIKESSNLSDGDKCNLWITGKAVPSGKKLLAHIPNNAKVINFSVPNPISVKLYKKRQDLTFIEGGLLSYDPSITDLKFTMRLKPGITYACHAGTMVHANEGWTHHEVGHVDMESIWKVWESAQKIGFKLPEKQSI